MENPKEIKKIKLVDKTKPSKLARIWVDPVWSKMISVLFIYIFATLFSFIQIVSKDFNFLDLINILCFKIQLYWFLIFGTVSITIIVLINYYIKKNRLKPTDLLINMRIGNFKYFELFNALNSHILPLPKSLKKTNFETINLLECFIIYARKIVDGVYFDVLDDDHEQFILHKICPLLEAYGLVERKKRKDPKPSSIMSINFYYISENGRKFYQAIQVYRAYIGEINEEW